MSYENHNQLRQVYIAPNFSGPFSKILNIQVARGLAATLVLLQHTFYPWFIGKPVGRCGVDLFFVISGFIMAFICHTNYNDFFLRRCIRIIPLYWILSVSLFLLNLEFSIFSRAEITLLSLLQNLLFIPNTTKPIVGPGWTLNYEMFFYLLIAICGFVSKKHAALVASGIIMIYACTNKILANSSFNLSSFFPMEFVYGVLIFYSYKKLGNIFRNNYLIITLLIFPLFALLYINANNSFSIYGSAIVYGIPSAFIILSAVLAETNGVFITNKYLVYLGDISYSLYLSHLFVILVFNKIVARSHPNFVTDKSLLSCIALVGTCYLIAVVIHHFIDVPIQRKLTRLTRISRQLC